jgi:catechol 2,3-dioxygenase-like lactoylglutathione lyase family enzyme
MTPGLLKRTTFIVRDAEAQADFYAAVFGFSRWYDHELAVDHRYPPTGAPDGARARLIICQAQDPQVGMIGFLQFLDAALEARPGGDGQLRIGDPVLVLNVADVDDTHARAGRRRCAHQLAPDRLGSPAARRPWRHPPEDALLVRP